MMWFKKHLAAIIIIAASIAATACVAYMIACDMKFTKIKNEAEIQALNFNAKVHANNEIEVAEQIAQVDADSHTQIVNTCMANLENELLKIKTISLPSDLLKYTVWQSDESGDVTGVFSYNNATGSVKLLYYSPGTSFAIINYDDKRILTSKYVENAMLTPNNKLDTGGDIKDVVSSCYCDLLNDGGAYFIDEKMIVPNRSYDLAPTTIIGKNDLQKLTWRTTIMPHSLNDDDQPVPILQKNSITVNFNSVGYNVALNNGRLAIYEPVGLSSLTKNVSFDGSKINISEYSPYEQNCGGMHLRVENMTVFTKDKLKVIGAATNGDVLYGYKDMEVEKGVYETIYYPDAITGENISLEKYLADHPYFIWFNGFGMPVQYQKTKYQSAAECGKPVIYLYPTKDMNVSVKVEPNGGFKKTEPAYNNGWNVWATTKSELTNLADGVNYPYLFWEGKAYNYATPDKGFVLKRENVARDMKVLLARLGLNEKESKDFMEFWQPKLETKPYVYVTFVSQEVFDQLAPLTVTPKPDKVIRVFMDYTPLENYMSVAPLKITTPERTGFTVVEWGGRLR